MSRTKIVIAVFALAIIVVGVEGRKTPSPAPTTSKKLTSDMRVPIIPTGVKGLDIALSVGGKRLLDDTLILASSKAPLEFDYAATNATNCSFDVMTADGKAVGNSGVDIVGHFGPIPNEHPWYPRVGSSRIFMYTCQDKSGHLYVSSLVVKLAKK